MNRGKVLTLSEAREENRHSPPPAEQKTAPQKLAFLKYAEAVNAERYRVTVIRMGEDRSRKVFILDKKNGQSMGFTPEELVKRMPELLKLQSRGENIYYTPLSEDKHHILIDDVTSENVVRLQKDGYRPAAIIESSPGNYQCVLTIPKFDGEFDRQIANQLTAMLNREYGDPQQAYFLHYEDIRSHLTIEDFSRVDAMIALRMRANGHSPNAELTAIRDCAPTIRNGRDKRRNLEDYAERMVNYAFGLGGYRDLERSDGHLSVWRKIEGIPASHQVRNSARLH